MYTKNNIKNNTPMYTKNNILTFSLGFPFKVYLRTSAVKLHWVCNKASFFHPSKILAGRCEIKINDFSKVIDFWKNKLSLLVSFISLSFWWLIWSKLVVSNFYQNFKKICISNFNISFLLSGILYDLSN